MYSAHFNASAEADTKRESQHELDKLDTDITHAVSMGNLEIEGGSVNGRAATGSAFTAEAIRIRQERKKKDTELIIIIEQLREMLQRMDKRIDQLSVEIKQLTDQKNAAEIRSEVAFTQMHDLENQLTNIEANGFSDTTRKTLKHTIGQEADGLENDEALLKCARSCMAKEQQNGIEAYAEVQTIDSEITARVKARDNLVKARDEIKNHPTASLLQKTTLAKAALEHSISEVSVEAEGAKGNTKQAVEQTLDAQRQELTSEDNFEFDENSLTSSAPDLNGLNF